VTPGAIAYLLTDRFDHMLLWAITAGISACVFGTYLSYHLDVATGGCIVVLLTLLFAITMLLAPKYGVFSRTPLESHSPTSSDDL
jgi:manganese transport system permease protein